MTHTITKQASEPELVKCYICGKEMKPDIKAKNFITKEWDGHTYFPCKCQVLEVKT